MKRVLQISLLVVFSTVFVGQASATYTAWFAVDWASPYRNITFKLTGYDANNDTIDDNLSANIGPVIAREADTQAHLQNPLYFTEHAPVFCVDIFHYAYDNWTSPYQVDVHTEADGTAGWTTPEGDGDEWRDLAGLTKAAALAQRFGTYWNADTYALINNTGATDFNDRSIALNVAIWRAAYGTKFVLRGTQGGMNNQQWFYYGKYLNFFNTGASTNDYTWFDSKYGDNPSTNQDFLKGEVPEPTSLLLIGGALAASGLISRRRRK